MNTRLLAVAVVTALAIWSTTSRGADEETTALIARINAAWKAREASIETFDAKWIQHTTRVAGTQGRDKDGTPLPKADKKFDITFRFVCDDDMARIERTGLEYDHETQEYRERSNLRVFDGIGTQELWEINNPGRRWSGWVDQPKFESTDWRMHPLVFAFRPASWLNMGAVKLARSAVRKESATVEGVKCHVFQVLRNAANPGVVETAYIADEPDFRVIRRELGVRGPVWEQITIDYEHHPKWGNVCKGWTQIIKRNRIGALEETNVVSKVEWTVGEPVKEEEFAIKFPPGCVVSQEKSHVLAVVRKDGTFRPVAKRELAGKTTWEQLMEIDPPPDAPKFNLHEP